MQTLNLRQSPEPRNGARDALDASAVLDRNLTAAEPKESAQARRCSSSTAC